MSSSPTAAVSQTVNSSCHGVDDEKQHSSGDKPTKQKKSKRLPLPVFIGDEFMDKVIQPKDRWGADSSICMHDVTALQPPSIASHPILACHAITKLST